MKGKRRTSGYSNMYANGMFGALNKNVIVAVSKQIIKNRYVFLIKRM